MQPEVAAEPHVAADLDLPAAVEPVCTLTTIFVFQKLVYNKFASKRDRLWKILLFRMMFVLVHPGIDDEWPLCSPFYLVENQVHFCRSIVQYI